MIWDTNIKHLGQYIRICSGRSVVYTWSKQVLLAESYFLDKLAQSKAGGYILVDGD